MMRVNNCKTISTRCLVLASSAAPVHSDRHCTLQSFGGASEAIYMLRNGACFWASCELMLTN